MNARELIALLMGLLAIVLIAQGLFQIFSPLIPGGALGWVVAGIILLVIMAWLFSRESPF